MISKEYEIETRETNKEQFRLFLKTLKHDEMLQFNKKSSAGKIMNFNTVTSLDILSLYRKFYSFIKSFIHFFIKTIIHSFIHILFLFV